MTTPETVSLTREELYAQVWSTPMRTLAQGLGYSDVGLAKHCKRMKIPMPGRGYWAKKSAGKQVRQIPLPALPPNDATISRRTIVRIASPPTERPSLPQRVAEQVAFEALPANRIEVADSLRARHPLVRVTAEALNASGKKATQYVGNWQVRHLDIDVSQALLGRALRIMDAMVKAFERRGWRVTLGTGDDRKTYVTIFEQRIPFGIREPLTKVLNDPAKPVRLRTGETYTPYQPKYRDEASGRLAIVIRHRWGHSVSKAWDERGNHPLETRLNEFVVAVVAEAHEEAERHRRHLEEQRQRQEAEQQRMAEQRCRAAEAARRRALRRQAARWRASQDLAEYLAAVRELAERAPGGLEPRSELAEWLDWAHNYARTLDPLSRPLEDLGRTPPARRPVD